MLRLVPAATPPRHPLRMLDLTPELLQLAIACEGDNMTGEMARVSANLLAPGLGFAIMEGGILACAMGLAVAHHGKGLGWMLVSPLATMRHMTFATRCAREQFDKWQQMPAFRRIEIHVRADQPWRESFAKALGMTEAFGPMRCWDPLGRDYWLYARVAG